MSDLSPTQGNHISAGPVRRLRRWSCLRAEPCRSARIWSKLPVIHSLAFLSDYCRARRTAVGRCGVARGRCVAVSISHVRRVGPPCGIRAADDYGNCSARLQTGVLRGEMTTEQEKIRHDAAVVRRVVEEALNTTQKVEGA